ncbi:cytochrome P450 6k1-like isoform X2 [Venturia canescens]|uniref:cytochrome P450 6k1-like isoform X2 n=1 Tax=Venturia canescens TaxID=32260 RepID=UPI001C9D2AB0|nr:cytochrome P450 6k1-like isoform X2 [Venturia canescens]
MEAKSFVSCVAAITVALIITSIYYIYAKYKLSYWKRRGIKSPPSHIIFGNMRESILLKKTPGQVLRDIYYSVDADEPLVGCYLFHKPLLIVRSLSLIKQFMIKDFETFPNRGFGGKSEADPLGYVSLLGIRKPRWKYLRGKLTPCLTGQKLRNMLPLIIECCHKLVDHIETHEFAEEANSQYFELKSTAGKYCTDVFASTAFGVTTNSFDENENEFWQAGQRVLAGLKRGIILIIHFYLPELIPITSLVSKRPAQFFSHVFWDSYKTRERVGNKRGDLVDFLMELKNGVVEKNPHFVFDGDNLVAQAVSFYVAGFEATSTTIAFALYDLSKNPIYEAQAYEEVIRIAAHQEFTMEMLNDMTFLDKCINESLRLHPPLPMEDRISVRDYRKRARLFTLRLVARIRIRDFSKIRKFSIRQGQTRTILDFRRRICPSA